MFNLETAIATWRRYFANRQALDTRDLDELERHLRDHISHLRAAGYDDEIAFQVAMQQLGDCTEAEPEYEKVYWGKVRRAETLTDELQARLAMLKNYITIAFRNVLKHKGYAFINVAGLAVGLACCLLIALYIQEELRFDTFHEKADRIVRIGSDIKQPGNDEFGHVPTNGWPVGVRLAEDFAEVEEVVYMRSNWQPSLKIKDDYFYPQVRTATANFFDVFTFPLIAGSPETALEAPRSVVITESEAQKYFNTTNVLGEILVFNDSLNYTITGVAADPPRHSHLQFRMLVSFSTFYPDMNLLADNNRWFDLMMMNYALLRPGTDVATFDERIEGLVMRYFGDWASERGYDMHLTAEPLADLYLRSDRANWLGPRSDMNYVLFLSAIALFVLVIAGINFINLATARSMERAKEVGVRKAVGSDRGSLIRQFLTESVVTSTLALALGLALVALVLPLFNTLVDKAFVFSDLLTVPFVAAALLLTVGVGLLAGLYPALVLSGYRPTEILKGALKTSRRGVRLRQSLVVFQFGLSCALIVGTLVVFQQLHYMQKQDLGFDDEQVVVVNTARAPSDLRSNQLETIKTLMGNHPAVTNVSASWATPGTNGWRSQMAYPEGRSLDEGLTVEYIPVDHDYVPTYGIPVVAGRNFSESFETDATDGLLVNETAVQDMGWETPENAIGKTIDSPSGYPRGTVVGVVRDFHQHGLQEAVGPIVLSLRPSQRHYLFSLRFNTTRASEVVSHIEQVWNQLFEGYPYTYYFVDEAFARQYREEEQLTRIFGTFAFLAIFIACLGLFGLAAFMTTQRTKEIGVRKVMGATVPRIVLLLSKEFAKLVALAFVLTCPIAWYFMDGWLADFAHRMALGVDVFLLAGGLLFLIAIATVSYQSIRAAVANPIDALRYE